MRMLCLMALFALPAAAQQAPRFDVDLAAGVSTPTTELYNDQHAPVVSLRLGFRPVDWLSLGLRGDAVLGAEGAEVTFTNGGERGGQKSFAGMADARLIWTSPLEVYLGGGIGLGHMVSLQCTCQENYAAHGTAKPIVQAALGIRYKAGLVWPGLELRALHWGDLETRGSVASPVPIPPIGRTEAWMLLLTLSLGVSIE